MVPLPPLPLILPTLVTDYGTESLLVSSSLRARQGRGSRFQVKLQAGLGLILTQEWIFLSQMRQKELPFWYEAIRVLVNG